MKLNKYIIASMLFGMGGIGLTSCEDFLEREPIATVTPDTYFTTVEQLAAYLNNYYDGHLVNSQGQQLYHPQAWNSGLANNDNNTDNLLQGEGNIGYFAGDWKVPEGQTLQGDYGKIRVWNYFLNTVSDRMVKGLISGDSETLNHYLGEGYFFRAMAYYNLMVRIGDLPIIKEVLPNEEAYLQEKSVREPRNVVARFILSDLDEAIKRLKDCGFMDNQRVNKQVALLYKSRVALFEGTFEKYHKGSGRVPGDANWPGKNFSGNIDEEIKFFFTEAMKAAEQVADKVALQTNSHVMNPKFGQIYGWNPYFEMFSQPNLAGVSEVLLWKEYNKGQNISHNAPHRLELGDNNGLTRSLISSFLMKNGLPVYASNSGFKGDKSLDKESDGRDERMQLFVWAENTVLKSDPAESSVKDTGVVVHLEKPNITDPSVQTRDLTGYRQRKHFTYDYNQRYSDELLGTNACPIFRSAEAYLNYIEACYEKDQKLDAKATAYWKAIRARAGVDEDFQKTIANTDMTKEAELNDLGVWSAGKMVDATLYNIRRERRCEFIGEGMRWDDLKRWRSWDRLFTKPFIPEGMNLWDEAYKNYTKDTEKLIADGTTNSNVSMKSVSKYMRPLQRWKTNNQLYNGYTWKKAYYLSPIGISELKLAPNLYQNPYWPSNEAGLPLE